MIYCQTSRINTRKEYTSQEGPLLEGFISDTITMGIPITTLIVQMCEYKFPTSVVCENK